MTERRCIAMGRGAKEQPHFYFYDIDQLLEDSMLDGLLEGAKDALIVQSKRGYHIVSATPITDKFILSIADPKCPGNAVRFYPHDDLKLVQRPKTLCIKVAKIYESVFNIGALPIVSYAPCDQPLKFGIYVAEKDGIKLHGDERTKAVEVQ